MKGLTDGPPIVFGHSWGGIVSLIMAAREPRTVRALVLEDSPLSAGGWEGPMRRSTPMLRRWRELARLQDVSMIRRSLREASMPTDRSAGRDRSARRDQGSLVIEDDPGLDFLAESLRWQDPTFLDAVIDGRAAMADELGPETLRSIRCPVLILQADPAAGGVTTDDEVAEAMRLLPAARRVRFDGVGHVLHVERPDDVVREVLRFGEEVAST